MALPALPVSSTQRTQSTLPVPIPPPSHHMMPASLPDAVPAIAPEIAHPASNEGDATAELTRARIKGKQKAQGANAANVYPVPATDPAADDDLVVIELELVAGRRQLRARVRATSPAIKNVSDAEGSKTKKKKAASKKDKSTGKKKADK